VKFLHRGFSPVMAEIEIEKQALAVKRIKR